MRGFCYCADNPDVVHWSCSKLSLKLKTPAKGACSVFFSALLRDKTAPGLSGAVFVFSGKTRQRRSFSVETGKNAAQSAEAKGSELRPYPLYGLSLCLSERMLCLSRISGHHLGESERDHAGCLHADPHHLDYRSHRHRVRGALDDELFPLRPDSRGVPGMAQTDHHHLGHPQRPRIHYGVCDALLPGGPVDAVQSLTAYGNFRWHCGLDRGTSHARPGLDQYISFGRSWL